MKDFPNPAEIIVAHSEEIPCYRTYAVLYLDGAVGSVNGRDELNALLRQQESLIAQAVRKKAKREGKI